MNTQREIKRGLYERKRRKKFLYFKHINRLDLYYGIQRKKPVEVIQKRKMVWWRRIIISIQRFFFNLKNGFIKPETKS